MPADTYKHSLFVRKEALKFASGHFTVFPDGTKEPLHGHNYTAEVRAEIGSISLKEMIPFDLLKSALRGVCEKWDERVLLAERNPFLKIRSHTHEMDFEVCGKHYVLPSEEVVLLPVENIAVENLAAEVLRLVLGSLPKSVRSAVLALEVRVEESPGQGASSRWESSR